MKKAFCLALLLSFPYALVAQHSERTSKSIFHASEAAVVQVQSAAGGPRGTGFFVSPAGLVVTANHVANLTDQSGQPGAQYISDLCVKTENFGCLPVKPSSGFPNPTSVANDYALLDVDWSKVDGGRKQLAYLKLGSFTDIEIGDRVSALGYPLNPPSTLLLEATVSGLLTNGVHRIIFQGPNNRGLSGGPLISNRTGFVVAIVTTKFVGLNDELEKLKGLNSPNAGRISIGNIDVTAGVGGLAAVLDNFLISGMGGAVSIEYAKEAVDSLSRETPRRLH